MIFKDTNVFQKIPVVAAALDPRHKHLKCFSIAVQMSVKEHLLNQMQQLSTVQGTSSNVDISPILSVYGDCQPSVSETESDTLEAVEDDHGYTKRPRVSCPGTKTAANAMQLLHGVDYMHSDALDDDHVAELERYLRQPTVPLNHDPLSWWKEHSRLFLILSNIAEKYLCVPATSVPSERVFSAAGLVLNRLRSRLSPEHVDTLFSCGE